MKHPNDSNCLNEMRLHNAAVGDVSRFFMQAGGKQLLHLRKAQRRNVLASKKVSRTQTLRPPPPFGLGKHLSVDACHVSHSGSD